MTTKVTVTATCGDTNEVVVQEGAPENLEQDNVTVLQNGDEAIFYAHSGNEVFVYERVKT